MIDVIGLWSHALAAILYGALAVWQLRHWNGDHRNRPLVAAFAVTALWAIFVALLGPLHLLSGLSESARNFAFLAFMYAIVRSAAEDPVHEGEKREVAGAFGDRGEIVAGAGQRGEQRP